MSLLSTDFAWVDIDQVLLIRLLLLKNSKTDSSGLSTEHLRNASPVIAELLSSFFSSLLRHGFMPACIRDCVVVPIPKGNRDTSSSHNYRPIALCSSLSKVLERLILTKYKDFFFSNPLQFGYKSGYSTVPDSVPLPANKTALASEAACDAASANRQLGPQSNSLVVDSGMCHFSRQSLSPTPLASADVSHVTRSVSPTGIDSSSSTVVLDDKHSS